MAVFERSNSSEDCECGKERNDGPFSININHKADQSVFSFAFKNHFTAWEQKFSRSFFYADVRHECFFESKNFQIIHRRDGNSFWQLLAHRGVVLLSPKWGCRSWDTETGRGLINVHNCTSHLSGLFGKIKQISIAGFSRSGRSVFVKTKVFFFISSVCFPVFREYSVCLLPWIERHIGSQLNGGNSNSVWALPGSFSGSQRGRNVTIPIVRDYEVETDFLNRVRRSSTL